MRSIALILVCLVVRAASPIAAQVEGLIVAPFVTDSGTYGWPGQLVRYVDRDLYVDVTLPTGATVELFVGDGDIVPMDSLFAPAYVLSMFRACEPTCQAPPQGSGQPQLEFVAGRVDLVQKILELFPSHADAAEFRAIECDLLRPMDGKDPADAAIGCAQRFATDYPNHPRSDEMEWRVFDLQNRVYEFEGEVELMRAQADAFEAFLREHPDSAVRDQIRIRVARLYYMMQEVTRGEPQARYRARAMTLYAELTGSEHEAVRLRAIIERFNLERGRTIYVNPNAWDPAF